jgi:hypothetical protein
MNRWKGDSFSCESQLSMIVFTFSLGINLHSLDSGLREYGYFAICPSNINSDVSLICGFHKI